MLVTCRFEVGVRVDGYAVDGERRHINSAFYTFRPKDDDTPLPELIPDTEVLDSWGQRMIQNSLCRIQK